MTEQPKILQTEAGTLEADLGMPQNPQGVILFAHGSGSSRHSPRNRQVAGAMQQAGFASYLMDLLTDEKRSKSMPGAGKSASTSGSLQKGWVKEWNGFRGSPKPEASQPAALEPAPALRQP